MTLTKDGYKNRLLDKKMKSKLNTFGAISIEGPKWSGKTWTMLNHAKSVSYLMDQETKILAEIDPTSALEGEHPHAIDEWQVVPEIWDSVRFAVDQKPGRGQYLLTGSVTPPDSGRLHSGIGRISTVRMRTLSLFESGDSTGEVSLADLLEGSHVKAGKSQLELNDIIALACKGGWPINLSENVESIYEVAADYLEKVIIDNVYDDSANIQRRDQRKFRMFMASLARSNASLIKNTTIHNEVQKSAGEFSVKTLGSYLKYLRDIYLLEEIPGWYPGIRSKARVLSSPKRFLTDPSLAVAAIKTTKEALKKDLATFGGIFEGLCLRDLLIYADCNDSTVFHYRDNSQLEVDAIIEKDNQAWGAFEIKIGGKGSIEDGAKSLKRLRAKMVSSGSIEPACLVVLTASGIAMRRDDGVMVVPIGMLAD